MPLEQLYQDAPMKEWMDYGPLMTQAVGPEGYQYARQRQVERDALIDKLNRQAVEEYNPEEVSRQRLANQQQQYMMPTYEAQGMAAQAQIDTPNYFQQSANTNLTGFGAKSAENINTQTKAEAQRPYIVPTEKIEGDRKVQIGKLQNAIITVQNFQGTAEEALPVLQKHAPAIARWIEPVLKTQGLEPARALVLQALEQGWRNIALLDPAHMREMDKIKQEGQYNKSGSASEAAVVQLARQYARAAGRDYPNQVDLDRANRQVQVIETTTKAETVAPAADGKGVTRTTTTTAGQQGGKASTAGGLTTGQASGTEPVALAPAGTKDGPATIQGIPVIVKGGKIYLKPK